MRNLLLLIAALCLLPTASYAGAYVKGGGGATESVGGDTRPVAENDRFIVGTHADPDIILDPTTRSIDIKANATKGSCVTLKEGSANGTSTYQECVADDLGQDEWCSLDNIYGIWRGTACGKVSPSNIARFIPPYNAKIGDFNTGELVITNTQNIASSWTIGPTLVPTLYPMSPGTYTVRWQIVVAGKQVAGLACSRYTITGSAGVALSGFTTDGTPGQTYFEVAEVNPSPTYADAFAAKHTGTFTATVSAIDTSSWTNYAAGFIPNKTTVTFVESLCSGAIKHALTYTYQFDPADHSDGLVKTYVEIE